MDNKLKVNREVVRFVFKFKFNEKADNCLSAKLDYGG